MTTLKTQDAIVRGTIVVTRKTGEVETIDFIGTPVVPNEEGNENGSDASDSGS
jgi:hypothetical protein